MLWTVEGGQRPWTETWIMLVRGGVVKDTLDVTVRRRIVSKSKYGMGWEENWIQGSFFP